MDAMSYYWIAGAVFLASMIASDCKLEGASLRRVDSALD